MTCYWILLTINCRVISGEKKLKYCHCGIITIEFLKNFPDHYIEGIFSPEELLQIFLQMCIVFEMGQGEFLMPCLLSSEEEPKYPDSINQAVPPMVIEFPDGGPIIGTYHALICYLITKKNWKLEKDKAGRILHLTRSSVLFTAPKEPCATVTINDHLSNFLVVTFHGSPVMASQNCPIIYETIFTGVQEVTKEISYSIASNSSVVSSPKVTFQCPCGNTPFHPAILSSEGRHLTCPQKVTTDHETWLGSQGNWSCNE